MAWRATENAPVITDWLAITAAMVARMIIGYSPQSGTASKNGLATASGRCSTSAPCPR